MRPDPILLSSGLLLVLAACSADAPTPLSQRVDAPLAIAPEIERRAKEQESRAAWRPQPIDWEAARAALDPPPLDASARDAVDAISMPVMLPGDAALLDAPVLTHGPGWYAASMNAEGLNVSIHGYARAFVRPELSDELGKEGLGQGPRVSRAHMITSVSFERFGVSYLLDVECAEPMRDPRCQNSDFALALFKGLRVAGGQAK